MEKLENHPMLAKIAPKLLTEIHGDLNIHNVLSCLDPEDDKNVVLIDPRGVPLLGDDSDKKVFERGDYCYDISKLLFSLTGFSEIRKDFFDYSFDDDSHSLAINKHPGSDTMFGAAHTLIPELKANKMMEQWINKVEKHGVRSFELRVKVGEAAHFVADCACALGRDRPCEIVPLFLIGLQKLNYVVDLFEGNAELLTDKSMPTSNFQSALTGANLGAVMIQQTLFGSYTPSKKFPYDVLEISVKFESASMTQKLLQKMVGTYFPEGTLVHLSTDPVENPDNFPSCLVIIHVSNAIRGQTHMLAAATRRTVAFFRDNGASDNMTENLRIVHISSTGSSSRSQLSARDDDKLLSPGSFGISPLTLAVMQANQLPFPKPGRWVVENDSFFLLSDHLVMSGDRLCLLAMDRLTSGSTSSWRVCIDKYEEQSNLLIARGFRNIEAQEKGKKLLRTTTGMFLPHHLSEAISHREDDYASRMSPLLFDIVLPRFMERIEWIKLCHQQGYGVDSHLVWQNSKSFSNASELVELARGGDKMAFYHFGSNEGYHKLLSNVRGDILLNSLAYAGAVVQWQKSNMSRRARLLAKGSA